MEWPGQAQRSPSLKLLLGSAARLGRLLRKARSRLLCCLASCSMVSSRWMRCSCSYCSARCHFRLCASASARKSLQAWRGAGCEHRARLPSPTGREDGVLSLPFTPGWSQTPLLPPGASTGTWLSERRGTPAAYSDRTVSDRPCVTAPHGSWSQLTQQHPPAGRGSSPFTHQESGAQFPAAPLQDTGPLQVQGPPTSLKGQGAGPMWPHLSHHHPLL